MPVTFFLCGHHFLQSPVPALDGLLGGAAASLWGWNCALYQRSWGTSYNLAPGAPSQPVSPLTKADLIIQRCPLYRKVERKHISLMCEEVTTWRMRNSPSFSTFYVPGTLQINSVNPHSALKRSIPLGAHLLGEETGTENLRT